MNMTSRLLLLTCAGMLAVPAFANAPVQRTSTQTKPSNESQRRSRPDKTATRRGSERKNTSNATASAVEETPLSDRIISLAVENELLSSEGIDAHRIDAVSRDGIVTLSGKVSHLLASRLATRIAQQVKGVRAVVNQIVVVGDGRTDKAINKDIQRALVENDVTEGFELDAKVKLGRATLEGTVDSYAEKDLAEQVVAGVEGVLEIENQVKVDYDDLRPDEEIREEVQGLIDSAVELDDADVTARVERGKVILNGNVGSAFSKAIAEQKAWVAGVEDVDVRGVKVDFEHFDGMERHRRMQQVTDASIVETVRLAMRQDPRLISYLDTIRVESDNGSVQLTGQVGRLRAKETAEEIARSTLGVWRVQNNLKVRSAEEEPTAQEIIDSVQAALSRDPYVSRHTIRVHCRNGHISLYGLVDSKFEKQVAGWVASGQRGVVHVNNSLAVNQEWEPKSDAEIKADIEEKLKFTFFDKSNDIEVTVEDGVAILRGEVDTWLAWQTAMNKAIEAGARRPHNLLKVRYHPSHGGSRIYVPR